MNIAEMKNALTAIAEKLLSDYAAPGWEISFEPGAAMSKTTLGFCNYATRILWVNPKMLESGSFELAENTMRHEAAHAIAGFSAGHGPVWRKWARVCGAEARACSPTSEELRCEMYKWRAAFVCPDTGVTVLTGCFTNRRTSLVGRSLRSDPRSANRLFWTAV